MTDDMPPLARRALVLGGLGVLTACGTESTTRRAASSSPSGSSDASPSATPSGTASESTSATPSTTEASPTPSPDPTEPPSPTPIPEPPPPLPGSAPWATTAPPSREAITAAYAGRSPQQCGTAVTGVISRLDRPTGVALTFDACGGPNGGTGYDEPLISFLRQRQVPATVFLNLRWINANPGLAAELAADPLFEVESHGVAHLPLSVNGRAAYRIAGTRDSGAVWDEVMGIQEWFLNALGRPPWFSRPGTAHADEVAVAICRDLGQLVAGFSINADAGATATPSAVAQNLSRARAGDVVIGHFNRPGRGTAAGCLSALPRLQDQGVPFVRLRDGF